MVIDIQKRIGDRILQNRIKQDMSREELAFRSGVAVGYLGYIERGKQNASVELLEGIANALGVELVDLIADEPAYRYADDIPPHLRLFLHGMTPEERKLYLGVMNDLVRLRHYYTK